MSRVTYNSQNLEVGNPWRWQCNAKFTKNGTYVRFLPTWN